MIVDDDSAVQSAIRLVLEPAGSRLFVAGDGRNRLSILEAENFDRVQS